MHEGMKDEGAESLTPREKIINSGIAERMLSVVQKWNRDPEHPERMISIDDCNFKVEVRPNPRDPERMQTHIVIEMPNLGPNRDTSPMGMQKFRVLEDGTFGAFGDEPLTEDQLAVIRDLSHG